ncbi:MAG: Ig-like domain-containing protein [Pseudolabrys sp.]
MAIATSTNGFPDATNTGVPAGVVLKASGSLVINTPGTVIEGLDITGSVTINAANVTLLNCKITSGDYDVVLVKPGITGAVVQNCEINNLGSGGQGIAGQGTFVSNNIHDCADGIDVRGDNTMIRDNFIHNMRGTSGSHYDGIQADGGFSNLSVIHNTVINEQNQTSALMLDNYWGPINNVKVDDNLLVGGGYTAYINEVAQGQAGGGPVTNVSFTNNHLGSGSWGEMNVRSELGDKPTISGSVSDGDALAQSLHMTGQPPAGSATPPAGGTPTPPSTVAPTIDSYSQDSGTKGDGITNDSTLTLSGKAAANSHVNIFEDAKQIGTATASNSGTWSYTTKALVDGHHSLIAKVTDATGKAAASAALAIVIDTVAPAAPTIAAHSSAKAGVTDVALTGTAEAHSTVQVFDGTHKIGTVTANDSGAWKYDAGNMTSGNHSLTATAADAAGNTSAASSKAAVSVNPVSHHADSVAFSDVVKHGDGTLTFKGTADANSHVNIYDNGVTNALGTVKADAHGAWSLTTKAGVTNSEHNFTAKLLDSSNHVTDSSGHASVGSTHRDTIVSSSGNDLMMGGGSRDTFVFGSHFGDDIIKDFHSTGFNHDVVQFSKSVFNNLADVLAHATQSGADVVISAHTGDTLTLKHTKMSTLDKGDFHFG